MFRFRMKMFSVFIKTTLSVAFLFMGLTLCVHSANSDVIPPHSDIYAAAKTLSLNPPAPALPLYTHQSATEPYDPLEPFNRVVFEFNRVLEGLLFNPLVHIYRGVVPPFVQKRVHCVLNNLATPVYFLNDVLQCKLDHACESLTRFIINTTFGLLGLFDVASEVGLPPHTEDLGQTLATWGAEPGPYLVLPILGPTDFRGLLGMVGDFFADPFNYYAIHHDRRTLMDIRIAATYADERSHVLTMVENLEETSVDYYAALRSLYWQHKRAKVLHDKEFDDNDETNSAMDSDHPQPEED
ncbi:MAG: hypothetical protein B7Y25_01785 [Alphaproteobacteria bacterium 16-39-46]|nr:MAG: hypothetical protein B7Y25_01785 [Alphaproteobacteria bacterium 16-39-46]OZA43971.1 MAG: hypothetical protein B7X84_01770 [Alphaproteobacteria bacterium 17-39-52]